MPQPWEPAPGTGTAPTAQPDHPSGGVAHASGSPKKVGSPDVVMLGTLTDQDFQAAVSKAREAVRARIGIPADAEQPPVFNADKRHPLTLTPLPTVPVVTVPPIVAPPVVAPIVPPRRRTHTVKLPLIGLCLLGLAGAAAAVLYFQFGSQSAAPPTPSAPVVAQGVVKIVSRPEGAQVVVDGVARGTAPLNLSLPVGEHTLELNNGTSKRLLPLTIESGAVVAQYIDLAAAVVESSGRLEVTSDPPGAQVTVDGTPRGATPLLVRDLGPGQHKVALSNGEATVTRTVDVAAGATATVVASMLPAGASAGWVSLKSPLALEILEGGRVLGATGIDRVMLPTGRHDLEVVAAEYEFRTPVTVQVQAGKTTTVNIALPNGSLSINAMPWAEVWLDGKPLGTTPLANLSVPIGQHEIVWKHPQLGERRQTVKVTAQSPVRAGMDLSK